MSVLIKDMEMPKCCYECALCDGEYGWCLGLQDKPMSAVNDRLLRCPLVEVKTPHGDLIDRKWIDEWFSINSKSICSECERPTRTCQDLRYSDMDICSYFDNAQTVIEAEE